jgi:hypothetical protein
LRQVEVDEGPRDKIRAEAGGGGGGVAHPAQH